MEHVESVTLIYKVAVGSVKNVTLSECALILKRIPKIHRDAMVFAELANREDVDTPRPGLTQETYVLQHQTIHNHHVILENAVTMDRVKQ